MTSGELLKERQGWCITRGDEAVRPGSSRFTLTMPLQSLQRLDADRGRCQCELGDEGFVEGLALQTLRALAQVGATRPV